MDTAVSSSAANGERVCDACLIKKTKCNRQKPTCSRCAENDRVCNYSTRKRKPGPSKGSAVGRGRVSRSSDNRNQRQTTAPAPNSRREVSNIDNPLPTFDPTTSTSKDSNSNDAQSSSGNSWKGYRMIDVDSQTSLGPVPVDQWGLSQEAERDLLQVYFESIQPLYPLFRKQDLLDQYDAGQISQTVLAAIFTVTAALSTNTEIVMRGPAIVGEHYATLTRQACSPLYMSDLPATINDLRALFLLALYEFRTSPNRRAFATAGHLVRLGYHYGLHQVDNVTNCAFYEPDITSSEELESWRYLWWSIYVLDTYCNSTASTPSNIELDSLCTALPTGSIENWTAGGATSSTDRMFLHGEIEDILSLLNTISSKWLQGNGGDPTVDVNFVIRLIITWQIREAFQLRRAVYQNPAGKFQRKHQLILTHLAAIRLALPASYQEPQRKFSLGEQKHDHTLRLVNLLEMQISLLPVTFPRHSTEMNQGETETWRADWDCSLEIADEIVKIIRHWTPSISNLTDPSVCYIIFIAMSLIHVALKLETSGVRTAVAEANAQSSWQLLRLFLEQLGTRWQLPKALIVAADKFKEAASGPITLADAYHISRSLAKPLTFRPRFEQKTQSSNVDYLIDSPFPLALLDSNNLQDWLNAFDQGDLTFV